MAYTGNITGTIGSALPTVPTGQSWRRNEMLFFQIVVTEDFYPGALRIYHRDDSPSRSVAGFIYDDVAGVPVNLLDDTNEVSTIAGTATNSVSVDAEFNTNPQLTAGTYWIGAWLNGSGFNIPCGVSTYTFPALTRKLSQFTATFPDPISGLVSSTFNCAIQFRYEAVTSTTPVSDDLTIKYQLGEPLPVSDDLTVKYALGTASAVSNDLRIKYRLGDEVLTLGSTDFVIPSTNANDVLPPAVNARAQSVGADSVYSIGSALQNPSPTTLPTRDALRDYQVYGAIYFKIWSIPRVLRLQNPGLNIPIPFTLWNAFSAENTLNSIGGSGQTGLTLDLIAPSVFFPVEEREVNVTIGNTAPVNINAVYEFNFALAQGLFDFSAVVAQFLAEIPQVPVRESWEWLTDILRADDGTEQRVALRTQPRMRLDTTVAIDSNDDRQQHYNLIYQSIGRTVAIPYFQYGTPLTADSAASSSELFFDVDKTDVRDGELVLVLDRKDGTGTLVRLDALTFTGATLEAPLTEAVTAGDVLYPAFMSAIRDNSSLSMGQQTGSVQLSALSSEPRSSTARPGSGAALVMFDGLPVLEESPLARNPGEESFRINYETIDSDSGLFDLKVDWEHAFVSGRRQFNIPRKGVSPVLDYWRLFLDTIRGQQKPFLMPTLRADLFLVGQGQPSASQLLVEGSDYQTRYFEYDTYKRLRLVNGIGAIHYTRATGVTADGDNTQISIDPPVPSEPEWTSFRIEFLNRVRLANDTAEFAHYSTYSILSINLTTTDQ